MREIDTVFMLCREKQGRMGVLYHRPGKTAVEAWEAAIEQWSKDFAPGTNKEDVKKSLQSHGFKAKRVRIFSIEK